MSGRLAESVILITGSTGIAAETAKLAAREGASVFIASRTEEHCKKLADEIRAGGGKCGFHAADLADTAAAGLILERCLETFGRLDSLYNVAGISGRRWGDGPLHECSEEGWNATMDTNVKSMFLMCRAALRHFLAQPVSASGLRGNILNMASVLAWSPQSRFFATHAYAASKGAIIAMSKAMASYYAPHKIRVNVIAPALIRTPMSQRAQADEELKAFMRHKQPLTGGIIDAVEVARASVFLLSNDARVITGDVLTVDAGWTVTG
jgi:NAD(P)-dependent dehydrogenase (short-subunit alcohol dehydrogenase family)